MWHVAYLRHFKLKLKRGHGSILARFRHGFYLFPLRVMPHAPHAAITPTQNDYIPELTVRRRCARSCARTL